MPSQQGLVWLVPGWSGTALYAVGPNGQRVKAWLDPQSILFGSALTYLTWGGLPPGWTIQPGEILSQFGFGYGGITDALNGLSQYGYQPALFGYDWRDTAMNLGPQLANLIGSIGKNYDNKIICHSYGTLVAQIAMGKLAAAGQSSYVSRVLAIGGIFSGTYGPAIGWREEEDFAGLLALCTYQNLLVRLNGGGSQLQTQLRQQVLQVMNSWPSLYDLLVDPAGTDDPGDTLRSQVWNPANWSGALVPPNASLMASSQSGFQTASKTPAYAVDGSKWLCIAGIDPDKSTPWRTDKIPSAGPSVSGNPVNDLPYVLNNPDMAGMLQRRLTLPSILYTQAGDNRSTLASQTRPGVPYYTVQGSHADLQSHPFILENLASLLGLGPNPVIGPTQFAAAKPGGQVIWPVR